MHAYYADQFVLPLPEGHRFPMAKYRLLREGLQTRLPGLQWHEAPAASAGELALAHDPGYIRAIADGTVAADIIREIGFPWSAGMAERALRSVGGTAAAARAARQQGLAGSLAGGTHHAGTGRGGGFCVFNDLAVTARMLQAEHARVARHTLRVAIVDLDVHQGNGTAEILANDNSVFTLSIHAEKNFPFRKVASDLDIGLPDGCTDEPYLQAVEEALATVWSRFEPEFILYLAGADPHAGDRLGRLSVSTEGMRQRDQRVLDWAFEHRMPVAFCMGGGYGRDIATTLEVQYNTWQVAYNAWQRWHNQTL
jgi:acetoin utilization deacetylase AcuC-like enzyme